MCCGDSRVDNLAIRDLHVRREGRTVLHGCNADFPARRRTVLWGRSGVGKSTLLSAIAGLTAPSQGTIVFGAQTLFSAAQQIDIPPHERQIGFVFQDLALWPHLTAIEQVHLVGRALGLDRAGALALLDSVGLRDVASRRPSQLSGGEQQRLAIARALAGQPRMLLLDEPFASVDQEIRHSLYTLIRDISPQLPGPTIYVTHNAEDAQHLAEYGVRLTSEGLEVDDRPWERSAV
jgi:ABC-type sulfate/molybdate transport systems ATPase subunit